MEVLVIPGIHRVW